MSKLNSSLLLLFLFLFVRCENPNQEEAPTNKEQEAIESLLQSYYEVMSERDWPRYQQFFSEKATLTTIWQKEAASTPQIHTNTITEFLAQTREGPDSQPIFEEKMTHAEIQIKGNLAQAWVNYEAKFGSSDNLMHWKGLDLFSFMRFKQEWKIVSLVFESE